MHLGGLLSGNLEKVFLLLSLTKDSVKGNWSI